MRWSYDVISEGMTWKTRFPHAMASWTKRPAHVKSPSPTGAQERKPRLPRHFSIKPQVSDIHLTTILILRLNCRATDAQILYFGTLFTSFLPYSLYPSVPFGLIQILFDRLLYNDFLEEVTWKTQWIGSQYENSKNIFILFIAHIIFDDPEMRS